jgi:site-specific recombinase XerD
MDVPHRRPRRRKPLDAGPFQPEISSFRLHLAVQNKAPKTVRTYTEAVQWFAAAHLIPRTACTRWDQVQGHDVRRWMVWLLGLYSDAYASNQYRALQQFFKWLAEEDELATGIRAAELARIRYDAHDPQASDVDLWQREITVRGKGGKARIVKITHDAACALDRYIRVRAGYAQAWRRALWLGVNNRGPLTSNGVYQMVARRSRECGVVVHPHRFRHHFSHTWLDRGGAEADLMELNGWSSPQMLRRYGASVRNARAPQLRPHHGHALKRTRRQPAQPSPAALRQLGSSGQASARPRTV